MNIEIEEKTCIRLGAFAHECKLSLSAAIDRLLDNQQGKAVSRSENSRLEVVYFPEGEENFKRALLAIDSSRRVAHIRIHYFGGRIAYKKWRAADIDANSLIRGNLASGHLRDWRQKGIVKAEVSLEPFADDKSEIATPSVRQVGGVKISEQGDTSWREQYRRFVQGRVDASATVDMYVNALDHLYQNYGVDVWGMRNIEEVRRAYKSLLTGGNLHQPNCAYNNRAMSAAVGKYVAFLQSENSG